MSPIKIAIVGLGQYAELTYLDKLLNQKEISLAAICDLQSRRPYITYKLPSIPFFNNFDELVHSLAFDALVISTPHNYHYTYALKGLKSSKHVFIDKPLALTSAESKEIIINRKKKTSSCPACLKGIVS